MATPEEDLKKAEENEAEALARPRTEDELEAEKAGEADEAARIAAAAPMQLGFMRFVYAAYMAGAILVAFLVTRAGHAGWMRLGQWKPEFGEPGENGDYAIYAVAAVLGIGTSLYYWRKQSARQYAIEVAEELSKVTWPNRKEVVNSTTVVLFYTVFATVFFALMDQFWKYVTDKIYSF